MIQFVIRNSSSLGFGLGVLIIFIVGALATIEIDLRAHIRSDNMVDHTLIVLAMLDETVALITDAETTTWIFFLSGDH